MNFSMGLHLEPRLCLERTCATCKRPIDEDRTGRPPIILETKCISLVGCVILGMCPSCHMYGLDDEPMRLLLRRLDRPRAPIRFSREELAQAKSTWKRTKK